MVNVDLKYFAVKKSQQNNKKKLKEKKIVFKRNHAKKVGN